MAQWLRAYLDAAVVLPDCLALELAFAPYGREPRLLVARTSRWAIVVSHLEEPGSSNEIAPGVEIEKQL